MYRTVSLLLMIIPFCSFAQVTQQADALVSPRIAEREISVGGQGADLPGYDNLSIQLAIDALEETGGTVILSPGHYTISAPLRLHSNIHLTGSGVETVLKRDKGVQTRYVVDADFGELKLTVENPDGFEIGMKVQVSDKPNGSCWNVSTAYITEIVDDIIYIDRGLIRDYRSDLNGLISNASSVIEVIEADKSAPRAIFFAEKCLFNV